MKVLFVHLLNNYTGSPKVLANFLEEYSKSSNEITLLTSMTDGCLSNISNVKYVDNKYRWTNNKILLTLIFIFSQIFQFFFILCGKKYDCIYINTILPFGAAFAAKIRREKVIYHVHEFYPNPHLMQKICVSVASKCADRYIFVSRYLESCYKDIFVNDNFVVHNSVSNNFHFDADTIIKEKQDLVENKFLRKQIVLPCALKKYKGVNLFLDIAKKMPDYDFLLVTSNSKNESDCFFSLEELPNNFYIKNQISNMSEIYKNATLVVNLTIPHGYGGVIETFSMILIEAFEYKTPCIAPCYGGPIEIIQNGENGFLLEVEKQADVIDRIHFILSNFETYESFSEKAYSRSKDFSTDKFIKSIMQIIEGV